MNNHNAFHHFRRPSDQTAGFENERVIYDSQPLNSPQSLVLRQSPLAAIDSRLLSTLAKLRDISATGHSTDEQIISKPLLQSHSVISKDANPALLGLHERIVSTQETPSRIDLQLPKSLLFARQYDSMEHDRFQDQQQFQTQDLPTPTRISPPYGTTSDHMDTATSTVNSAGSGLTTDLSPANYAPTHVPRGRPPRLGTSGMHYRPMHTQQSYGPSAPSNMGPYYAQPVAQAQNAGHHQQQQHYVSQPMSPALYYPTFPHMQATSPSAYNVNQGYMGQVPTSAGPSMPVTTYAYSHPYPHVSDHSMHSFAYPGVGQMTPAPMSLYTEVDPQQQQQQMQNRGGNVEMMTGYVPVMTTTGPAYGYSIPAYAPTGTNIFTPQYSSGHPYGYNPHQSQQFSTSYGQGHQGPRPPPLNLSQQPAPIQGSSQSGLDHPHAPPSPLMYPNPTQGTPGGYSPIVVSPSPGGLNQGGRPDYIARSRSGSNSFLGLNPAASNTLSGYGSSGAASSGEALGPVRMARPVELISSAILDGVDRTRIDPDTKEGNLPDLTSQRERAPAPTRGDRSEQQQASPKGERSEWVMWVGNVPGDASLNELYTFFGQGPPIPEEERKATEDDELSLLDKVPQLEGAAIEPDPRDGMASGDANTGVGVGGLSGVISVFLISRSNCAFVNYISEASLQRGVDYFNGRPLRNPQVDSRCPKLVCRVRKKGDDVKAGVGGQRGVGTHARWVKEKRAAGAKATIFNGEDGPADRPPLVHAGNAKKSSSGSSVSFASTNSSMLQKYFPIRYFILKSLTQHDLDLSVERGLWATQVHNQEVLDQAYRTSQTVYLIFGVNKSGEFFGYAKMDGPISQVEANPSVEWAARDPTVSPNSARLSPVAVRGTPSQPTIQEAPDQEEAQELDGVPPSFDDKKPNHAATTDGGEKQYDPHRFSSLPLSATKFARHSSVDGLPDQQDAEKSFTSPHHQISEPIQAVRHREQAAPPPEQSIPLPGSPAKSESSPTRRMHPSMARLLSGAALQDSPDPLTPGEDQKLHSLDNVKVSSTDDSQRAAGSLEEGDKNRQKNEPERDSSGFSIASAPAVMGRGHKPLSASTPIVPSDTWDEMRRDASVWTREHSIEEEVEGADDAIVVPPTTHSLQAEATLAPVIESDEMASSSHLQLSSAPTQQSFLGTPGIRPDSDLSSSTNTGTTFTRSKEEKPDSYVPAAIGGREDGWGTPFKVKWIRTDPLPFQRSRHLRNPWNHDREIKVSRDGTEIEPGVGQRLLEEWERPDAAVVSNRAGMSPRGPTSYGGPPSPVQPLMPRGRGRGRGAMGGGWSQRDTGQ